MKLSSIKTHLKDYSIYQKRWTTVNHAFAAALSAADVYDEQRVSNAIRLLGQNPDSDLLCVYCGKSAETWDHISSTVDNGGFSGIGHQVGNLLPCCKTCNSKKGSKPWRVYLNSSYLGHDEATIARKETQISRYLDQNIVNTKPIIEEACAAELATLKELKERIYALMKEADVVSATVRAKVRARLADKAQ